MIESGIESGIESVIEPRIQPGIEPGIESGIERSGPVVWKFGGSSVCDAQHLQMVAGLVEQSGETPVVVVSAMGDTTDELAALVACSPETLEKCRAKLADLESSHLRVLDEVASLHPEGGAEIGDRIRARVAAVATLLDDPPSAARADGILALGEDLSSLLLTAALRSRGMAAQQVDARELIRTDDSFGEARPQDEVITSAAAAILPPLIAENVVAVVQGFVGASADGRTTTLGRGGSDLTATLLGAALGANSVHIWTDVDGIMSGDPRHVAAPRVLDVLGFEEAVELAYFGAGVLHAGAAKQAVSRGVPVRIRSTFFPERPGTLILKERWGGPEIAAVAHKSNVTLIKVRSRPAALPYGFLARVFEIMNQHALPVDLVATSHTSTAFTLDGDERIDEVAEALGEVADVEVRTGLATVTVVGSGLLKEPGFDARVFRTVAFTPVHLISQASDVSLSFVVDGSEAREMVVRLHRELVEGRLSGSGVEKQA